jgi:hypothetical protein
MFGNLAIVYLLLFLIRPWKIFGAQTCYFPDADIAVNDTPCTSNNVSICCQTNATCLENGLCFDPFGSAVGGYIRGSCTDKSWQSVSCPQYCTYGEFSCMIRPCRAMLTLAMTSR